MSVKLGKFEIVIQEDTKYSHDKYSLISSIYEDNICLGNDKHFDLSLSNVFSLISESLDNLRQEE